MSVLQYGAQENVTVAQTHFIDCGFGLLEKVKSPTEEMSDHIFKEFIKNITFISEDPAEFIEETKRIIKSISRLSAGYEIFNRYIKAQIQFTISSGSRDVVFGSDISLNHKGERYYIARDSERKRYLVAAPRETTVIHELLHLWHKVDDKSSFEKRCYTVSRLPEMDDQEEELTITGSVSGDSGVQLDICSENMALQELKLPARINHRALLNKNSLHELVRNRIISSIKGVIPSDERLTERNENNLTPLELALLSSIPENEMGSVEEWNEVIDTLVYGCKSFSDDALETAVLIEAKPLVEGLQKNGGSISQDLYELSQKSCEERCEIICKKLIKCKIIVSAVPGYILRSMAASSVAALTMQMEKHKTAVENVRKKFGLIPGC